MEQLKKVLEKTIEKSGFKNAILQENAVSIWPDVVGKNISNISKATNVDKGVLFIKVESATWKQELYMQKNEIINKINNSRYTRIPFWKDNPENIIGLLNVRTLNIDLKNHNESKEIIFDKISNPWFIPETTNLLEQLVEFKKRKEHLAFVVDEFGELLGLITLEDIIEEIVGEIVDEIDVPENDFKLNNYGKMIINGEKNIRDLYKSFDLDPPEIESSTIAGYILDMSKKIPSYGESFTDNFFSYKIL